MNRSMRICMCVWCFCYIRWLVFILHAFCKRYESFWDFFFLFGLESVRFASAENKIFAKIIRKMRCRAFRRTLSGWHLLLCDSLSHKSLFIHFSGFRMEHILVSIRYTQSSYYIDIRKHFHICQMPSLIVWVLENAYFILRGVENVKARSYLRVMDVICARQTKTK